MTTTPETVSDFARLSREAALAKDFDLAETYLKQAQALKALDMIAPTPDTSQRLPFPANGDNRAAEQGAQHAALKMWYTKQYGDDLDRDVETVLNDLYGHYERDYRQLRWMKTGDFLRYIKTGQKDEKLHRLALYTPDHVMAAIADGMSVKEIKATQVESQDTLGGYLVPPDFQDKMIERLQGLTPMRKIAESMTTVRDRVIYPVATGGDSRYTGAVRVFKVDESPTGTEAATNATFGNVTIPVYTIMGHAAVSKDVLEDTSGMTAIASYLERQFASAYYVFEDEQFTIGNGVGGPQGILQNGTTGGPNTYAYGTIATVNSGSATAIPSGDAVIAVPYGIDTQYRQAGGMWLMSRGTKRVIRSLKAGDGTYLWADRNQQLREGEETKLEGFPISETEVLASPTANSGATYTSGVYPIVFLTRGSYLIVDRASGMDVQRYDDSTTAKQNQIVLVLRRRVGGQVILPWGISTMKLSS